MGLALSFVRWRCILETERTSIVIAGEGAQVTIRIAPGTSTEDGFVAAEVEVYSAGFRGAVRDAFALDDLVNVQASFADAVRCLEGRVELFSLEGAFQMLVEMQRLGHARVSGAIERFCDPSARLTFEFATDQTYLAASCRDLRDTVSVLRN